MSRTTAATPPTTTAVKRPGGRDSTVRRAARRTGDDRRIRVGRQRWQPLNHRHQLTEPFRREEPVEPSSIVILVQSPRRIGRIESGVEAIAFGVGHWSIRGAPIRG